MCCCVWVLYLYKVCALSLYNRSNNNNTSQNTTIHKTIFTFQNTREDVDNYCTMFCDHNPHMAICRVVFTPAYLETSRWWQTQRAAHLKSCETPSPSDIKSVSVLYPDKQSLKPAQTRYNPVEVRGDALNRRSHWRTLQTRPKTYKKTGYNNLSITNTPYPRAPPVRSSADLYR